MEKKAVVPLVAEPLEAAFLAPFKSIFKTVRIAAPSEIRELTSEELERVR